MAKGSAAYATCMILAMCTLYAFPFTAKPVLFSMMVLSIAWVVWLVREV